MNMPVATDMHPSSLEDTRDAKLINNIAEIHQQFGMHATALKLLHLSAWIAPDQSDTLRLMANSFFKTGQFRETLSILDRLVTRIGAQELSETENLMRVSALALLGRTGDATALLQQQTGEQRDED